MAEIYEQRLVAEAIEDVFPFSVVVFSFICGSVAKKKSRPDSDVDIFLCLHETPSLNQKQRFTDNYMELHRSLNRLPDGVYPSELMTLEELDTAFSAVEQCPPHTRLTSAAEYDGIVWAGMLHGDKITVHGDDPALPPAIQRGTNIVTQWCTNLRPPAANEYTDMDLFLKSAIAYEPKAA